MSDKPSEEMDEAEPKGHGIESMRVEPIDNGYMVHTHMKPKAGKSGENAISGEPQKHFFPHHDAAADHIRKTFGGK